MTARTLRTLLIATGLTLAFDVGMEGRFIGPAAFGQAPAAAAPKAVEADPLLGERLSDLARNTLAAPDLSTPLYRQAGSLLEAAARLNPTEARFHRQRYEAMLNAGDVPAAIESLVSYARLDTTDLQAQAKLVELYTQRMETAEDKLKYLRQDLLTVTSIPAEIRSHAAVMATQVLLERGERSAAVTMANEAARLNPLNVEAQRLRFDLALRDGNAIDRFNGLLSIVRASPLDVGAVLSVADELSEAGIDDSVYWYEAALKLCERNNTLPPRPLEINQASRLFVSGRTDLANRLVTKIIAGDPADVSAHLIRASLDRVQGDPAEVARNRALARTALTNRLAEVAKAAGDTTAATRPSATTEPTAPPDPVALALRIDALKNPALRDAYIQTAGDLAFFNLFFLEQPAPAQDLIDGLKKLLPPESPLLARLEGWSYLVKKSDAEARQKLTAIEATDPLASLGLLRLEPDTADGRQAAETRARGLRSSHSHGVLGAILFSDLAARRTPLVLTTEAEQMRTILGGFPRGLLRIIDAPQTFYFVRAEPVSPSVEFGRPMLVKITLINISDLDLSVGPKGAIRTGLLFNAQVRGLKAQMIPRAAFDELAGSLVLKPRQAATRVVRFDQGQLLTLLRTTPYTATPITGSVLTNPTSFGESIGYGAGGYEVQFSRLIEQSPVPISLEQQRKALTDGLQSGAGGPRLALIDAASIYYAVLAMDTPEEQRPVLNQLRSLLEGLANDPDPTARAWGSFRAMGLLSEDTRVARARSAAGDPYWCTRLLALVGLRSKDHLAEYRDLAARLASDPDPTVARYAKAVTDELEELAATAPPATTPPTTRP